MTHHHHATISEVIVFHGEDEDPFYVFKDWVFPETAEPCSCGLPDPRNKNYADTEHSGET